MADEGRTCRLQYGKQKYMKTGYRIYFTAAALLLAALFVADLMTGSAGIWPKDVLTALAGKHTDSQTALIVNSIRLPKALTALLAGTAVSLSGLLMQTLFRNPLAGPFVLGISSGASLGAALCVLGLSSGIAASALPFAETLGVAGAAWTGAAAVLGIVMAASRKIGDNTVILILGMMLGAGIDAVVQILQYLSDEQALKSYIVWTMGSLGNIAGAGLWLLAAAVIAGTAVTAVLCKPLNLLLTGEDCAASAGTDVRKVRALVFMATTLMSGTVTAFCGPLGFLGLAVPHLARIFTGNSDHRVLIPATILCGGAAMLLCDIVSKSFAVPVNAVASLIGIPVIIRVVLRSRRA